MVYSGISNSDGLENILEMLIFKKLQCWSLSLKPMRERKLAKRGEGGPEGLEQKKN